METNTTNSKWRNGRLSTNVGGVRRYVCLSIIITSPVFFAFLIYIARLDWLYPHVWSKIFENDFFSLPFVIFYHLFLGIVLIAFSQVSIVKRILFSVLYLILGIPAIFLLHVYLACVFLRSCL